ncbi:cytochrome P450 4d8-like [Musca domestica]|uniref:Cytochrome P450 4d8-like n=1 Tax=Musca domestica TaxID=7370 RepID=A0A9J7CPI4_MUSDO|nr:cytochrome P450 4d8-like [Musca domestica]
MYIFAFVVLFLIFWTYQLHKCTKAKRDAVSNIPGPPAIPIIGCLDFILKINPRNVSQIAIENARKYGPIIRIWAFNRLLIGSSDTELNEQILSSSTHISKQRLYGLLKDWLGVGLLLSDGKKWHTRRKIITPTFHFKILEDFLQIFNCQSMVLLDNLAEKADGKTPFDVYPLMSLYTLDIIAESAMGTQVNAQTKGNVEYAKAVSEMTELSAWKFVRIHLNNSLVYTILHPRKKLREIQLIRIMRDFTKKVIEERREYLLKNSRHQSENGENENDIGFKKRSALLDVLLQSTVDGKPLTNEDIREEVDTFMFEGHDTTATALSFTLYLLARNPRVQNKVLAEIHQVYGDDLSVPFTLMNLNDLKYMEWVIRESMRIYPAVPIIGREIKTDFHYTHSRIGNGVIPAGTEFILNIFLALNDPRFIKDPEVFRPERFADISPEYNFNSIPFSAGPRNCIGQKFAMYEMKLSLAKIIHNFELLPLGEPVQPSVNIVLRSVNGMQLTMKKRS